MGNESRSEKLDKKPIQSFADLEVYKNAYKGSILICTQIINKLPKEEKYNLKDQIRRSCMAIPPLIAEGYAKKHHKKAFPKYLDDALGESNETIVHLTYIRDLYSQNIDLALVEKLINLYNIIGKQLYNLSRVWKSYS